MSSLHLDEPYRPPPGINNVWYQYHNSDCVIVFVHGVLSDSRGCWYREPTSKVRPGIYWPKMLAKDEQFGECSLYLGGYYTEIDAGPYEIADCAEELFRAIDRPENDRRAVLEHQHLLFVCHSTGGIVTRYMLESRPKEFENTTIGLVLIASPSFGADLASKLDLIAQLYNSRLGIQLQWGNWSLRELDDRFKRLIKDKGIPRLSGIEACENHFIFHRRWLPDKKVVVSKESAGRYFGPAVMLRNTDHFTSVKPDGQKHPAYELLADFYREFKGKGEPVPSTQIRPSEGKAPGLAAKGRQKTLGTKGVVCEQLRWDLTIDEEGDAFNEMSYAGMMFPNEIGNSITLPPAEVQSGHMEPYTLVWRNGRTSEGVSLDYQNADPRTLLVTVNFANRPTKSNPANFCLSSYDWNVYCMNMEEFRQKPAWREDGLDYAQKTIDYETHVFSLVIRFPEQMRFARPPFFEVYAGQLNKEQRDEELTRKLASCFYYSPILNTAVLYLQHPPASSFYRVSWVLGEGTPDVTSALIPVMRVKQRAFSARLIQLRAAIWERGTPSVEDSDLNDKISTVLSSFIGFAQSLLDAKLAGAALDLPDLEVSLMVLDEKENCAPALRIVAGTHLTHPGYRALALGVGDGNAGRAWKQRIARVYDRQQRNPKSRIYVAIPGAPQHVVLFSIPLLDQGSSSLVYAILNIGTFSVTQGELLRVLVSTDVASMTNYAQSYVLKRLIELLNM
jgi:hypothetical protein